MDVAYMDRVLGNVSPETLSFQLAKSHQPQRVQRKLVLYFIFVVCLPILSLGFTIGWPMCLSIVALLAAGMWIGLKSHLRKRYPLGVPSLQINSLGLSGPVLEGKCTSFAWKDLERIKFHGLNGIPIMEFNLKQSINGLQDVQPNIFSRNRKVTRLRLNMFEPYAQEAIVDAVNKSLVLNQPNLAHELKNLVAEERQFKEVLRSQTPHALATWALVAVNVAIWLIMAASTRQLIQPSHETLLDWGANSAWEVQHGAWWRLGSSIFLHSGVLHLVFNMAALLALGTLAERLFGTRYFIWIYLTAGLVGSALSLSFSAQKLLSVGASGAIFGVAGALVTTFLRHHEKLPALFGGRHRLTLLLYVLYTLSSGFGRQGIDNAAHIGGLVAGCLMVLVFPSSAGAFRSNVVNLRSLAKGMVCSVMLVGVVALIAPLSATDHRANLRNDQIVRASFQRFDAIQKLMQADVLEFAANNKGAWAIDNRGRTVYAPELLVISKELAGVRLNAEDPRLPLVRTVENLTARWHEMTAMPSVRDPVTGDPIPQDPVRFAILQAEAKKLSEQATMYIASLNKLTGLRSSLVQNANKEPDLVSE